jgi:hypothetical protein
MVLAFVSILLFANKLYFSIANTLQLKKIDEIVFEKWFTLHISEKLPYLLDEYQLINLQKEFEGFAHRVLKLNDFNLKLSEFQTIEKIKSFFENCDSDNDKVVDFIEYAICRGYYDVNGNANDVSDFDDLESTVLDEYRAINNNNNIVF